MLDGDGIAVAESDEVSLGGRFDRGDDAALVERLSQRRHLSVQLVDLRLQVVDLLPDGRVVVLVRTAPYRRGKGHDQQHCKKFSHISVI